MATEQELVQALMRADRAGDEESARAIAGVIRRQRAEGPAPADEGVPDIYTSSAATSYLQGVPLVGPVLDEVAAGLWAVPAAIETGNSVPEAYRGLKRQIDRNTQAYREENPGKSLAIELGTSLSGGGMGAAQQLARGATRAGDAARAVGANVAEGAAAGVAASDRNSIEETLTDALVGGGFGLLGGTVDARTALRMPSGAARAAAPSTPSMNLPATAGASTAVPRQARGFPLTPGEIRARDTGFKDITGMREENAARRGLLGPDPEQAIAEAEATRDEFVRNALLDGRGLEVDIGQASDKVQEEVLQTVERMRQAKSAAYRRLTDYEPYLEPEDLGGALRSVRNELFEPPGDGGFAVPVTPEDIAGMPNLKASIDYLGAKLGRVMPDDASNLLASPAGRQKFSVAEMEGTRRFLQGKATEAGRTNPNEARIIRDAVKRLDEVQDQLYGAGKVKSTRGDPQEFRAALAEARQANREYMEVVDGKVTAGRRRVKTKATKLVEDLQSGAVRPTEAVDRVVTSTGAERAGGHELMQEIAGMAPQSAAQFRGAIGRRLFGNTVMLTDDGALQITDRRALLNRLEKALQGSPSLYDEVFGEGWTAQAKELIQQAKPSTADIGRMGNRFDPLNPSGSGSMTNLYNLMYTGMRAIARGMFATRVLAPAAAGVSAVASGLKETAEDAVGSRVSRAVLDQVVPADGVLPEEFVRQWRTLGARSAAQSISTSGGQAATADREKPPQPSLL